MKRKDKVQIAILQLICIIFFFWIYPNVLCVWFKEFGYELFLNSRAIMISLLYVALVILIESFIINKFMYTSHIILSLLIFAPAVVMYAMGGKKIISLNCFIVFSLTWLCVSNVNIKVKNYKVLKCIGNKKVNSALVLAFLCLITIIIVAAAYKNRVDIKNFLLINVYETRSLYSQISIKWIEYIRITVARVIAPFLLLKALDSKKIGLVIFSIGTIGYLYLFGALKSVLFGLAAALIFYIFKSYMQLTKGFIAGVILACVLGSILIEYFDFNMLINYVVRRLFFAEALMDDVYYEHFALEKTYWMHTKLGVIFNSNIYGLYKHLPTYVGEVLLKTPGMSANVGIITEGYVAAGYMGVLIESLVVSCIFKFFSKREVPARYFGMYFMYLYYINTSLITTLFLTHGLLGLMIGTVIGLKRRKQDKGRIYKNENINSITHISQPGLY